MMRSWLSNFTFCVFAILVCNAGFGQEATKWTNPEGKEIVGDFVRMDGKVVTLRLASGKELKVPLSSLSIESHLQALKLAKPDNFTKELVKAPEVVEPAKLTSKMSVRSALTSPFEDDPSIDAFMQTFTREANRGNVFVVWHMMPPKMQNDMSAIISKVLTAAGPSAPNQLRKIFTHLASVVSKKRDWILDPDITGIPIPEEQLPEIKNAWPSIVGFLTDMSEPTIWDTTSFKQENIPNFLASLAVNAQHFEAMKTPDSPQLAYNIVSQSADRAEVEFSVGPQKFPVVQFQKVGKVWVAPEIMNPIRKGLDGAAKMPMGPEIASGFGSAMFIAMPILSKLDDAKTKDEFKNTVETITKMIPPLPTPADGMPGGFPFPGMGGK